VEQTLHPNYGFNNGSIDNSWGLYSLVYKNANSGFFTNLVVKKARIKIVITNNDLFVKQINFLQIPYASSGTLGANVLKRLALFPNCKSFTLEKAGVHGDTKTITLNFDLSKIEGYTSMAEYENTPSYFASNTTRGTNYSAFYMQGWSLDDASIQVSGCSILAESEYDVSGITQNVSLGA